MKLETLYKRAKTGKIQYWQVETKLDDGAALIHKEAGQLGTVNPTIHIEEVREGKQKRSYAEQADFQAQSDWKKKKDEGYKSLKDLSVELIGDKTEFQKQQYLYNGLVSTDLFNILNQALSQSNTDANGNVKPMLATDWTKVKNIPYPVYCEPKLDGVRCLMIVSGEEKPEIKFLSRSGKPYTTLGHIENDVLRAWDPLGNITSGFILDGEIYSEELSFQEIIRAVKKQSPNSTKLHFRAYDVVNDKPQQERRDDLQSLVKAIDSEFVSFLTWFIAHNADDVKKLHDGFVQDGNEGAMLRFIDGKYGQGQRSRELLKVKEFDETEFTVLRFEFGQRGAEDLLAVCEANGSEFKAKMMGSVSQKEEMYEEYKDKTPLLTVKHFGMTDEGLPRFPIGKAIRTDV